MEFEVEQSKLAKALNIVSRVASGSRATLLVLNNVLIRIDEKKASLVATNLDMAIVDFLPVVAKKDGVITIPAKLIADFISNLPKGQMISIKVDGTKVVTKAGKYSSTVNGTLADEFPELPELETEKAVSFKMDIDDFKLGMSQVMGACSNDMTRPALTGVFFNTSDGALYVASTDGYRLSERKIVDEVESEVAAIVPASSLQEVMKSISDDIVTVEIIFDDTQVRFRLGEIEITSKLIDGSYPDYRQLIPKNLECEVALDRNELLRMTKLAALFARGSGGSVVCEAKMEENKFTVAAVANEYGENVSEIDADVEKDEKITINSRYLTDALNMAEEAKIKFGFAGGMSPIVIRNEKNKNYTHIIMPLKS